MLMVPARLMLPAMLAVPVVPVVPAVLAVLLGQLGASQKQLPFWEKAGDHRQNLPWARGSAPSNRSQGLAFLVSLKRAFGSPVEGQQTVVFSQVTVILALTAQINYCQYQ